MPQHRKNSARNTKRQPAGGRFVGEYEADWFAKNRIRERARRKRAKESKRKNRHR